MKLIPLTRGMFAKVDDADYDRLSQHRWHAVRNRMGGTWYAVREIYDAAAYAKGKKYRSAVKMHAEIAGKGTDHRDGDGLNNQRDNLRPASKSENNRNIKIRKDNTSGTTGVFWDTHVSMWRPRIWVCGKCVRLGSFSDKADAVAARRAAEEKYFGEFSLLRSRGKVATITT